MEPYKTGIHHPSLGYSSISPAGSSVNVCKICNLIDHTTQYCPLQTSVQVENPNQRSSPSSNLQELSIDKQGRSRVFHEGPEYVITSIILKVVIGECVISFISVRNVVLQVMVLQPVGNQILIRPFIQPHLQCPRDIKWRNQIKDDYQRKKFKDLMLETACIVAFHGFLRCGEFTVDNASNFDSESNLCVSDEACEYRADLYNGHSFRIGAATSAGKANIGDHLIKTLSRWNSDSYCRYVRTHKTSIKHAQKKICNS
ncbi:unnamed protein product [Mytilus coruscus]|uniref:Uncharacterized protein n=1 Tax=Mytilus coruscus TaxID=42192 RepID=A0A6J8AB65_MYTCO|nr:unnamed protein product [Mytilus coruscus]